MPLTVNSDMVIYNTLAQTAYLERLQDVLDVFNSSSQGTITFRSESIEGNFKRDAFYRIGGQIEWRDVNSNAPVLPTRISADEKVSVKVPWKYGPFGTTNEAFKRRARNIEEFALIVGQDMADSAMAHWIGAAMSALTACITNSPNLVVSAPDFTVNTKLILNDALRRFGDRSERLRVWVMNANRYRDIVDNAIVTQNYDEIGMVVYGGQPGTLGRPVLVTDRCPEGTIFALQPGAISVVESQAPESKMTDVDFLENLGKSFRAEGVYNLEALGYSYDSTAGANPTPATVANPDSWERWADSDKLTAGVMIQTPVSS